MFDLPKSAYINKTIPKNRFEKLKNIQKIIWLYNLSEKTLNLEADEKLQEIQIFKIISPNYTKNELFQIQKKIPYPILFILDDGFGMFDKDKFYFKEKITPNFSAKTSKELFENLLREFFEVKYDDFNRAKELDSKIKSIKKEIESLKSKIKKEKQFKYKVELNKKLLRLQGELKDLDFRDENLGLREKEV